MEIDPSLQILATVYIWDDDDDFDDGFDDEDGDRSDEENVRGSKLRVAVDINGNGMP